MPPKPKLPLAALRKLASSPEQLDLAATRFESLPPDLLLDHYSPSALARALTLSPAAQRGFSESIVSTRPPAAIQTMRPSQFLENTPPLTSIKDRQIVDALKASIQKDKLRDLPLLWIDEYPSYLEAGYEGRHRMTALQELLGDEPILQSIVQGDRYKMSQLPYYPEPVREWASEATLSPLEMLKQKVRFGDSEITLDPLWRAE